MVYIGTFGERCTQFATGPLTREAATKSIMRSLHYYLLGTGSWFLSFGIQSVLFAWLVTMVLRESPERVGIAQMAMLLPGTVLMLVGGSLADRYGGRRLAIGAQSVAVLAPLFLLVIVGMDRLVYSAMIAYAIIMGCAQAFVTPARDGLLNQVAEGRIQRTVVLASLMQFSFQMVGFVIAAFADFAGPVFVLSLQVVIMIIGVWSLSRIQAEVPVVAPSERHVVKVLLDSVVEGARTVWASRSMRIVMWQNVAMALFFMGTYIVTLPLLVREVYDGSSTDLAWMNAANALGMVVTIFVLLRAGDVRRVGRALLISHGIGAVGLGLVGTVTEYWLVILLIFFWGVCGGVAMSMSRTIMQEQAPESQRGRVMAFYSFSFMGAGPVGALFSGFLVEQIGPPEAIIVSAGVMLIVVLVVGVKSKMWQLEGAAAHPHSAAA